MNDCRKTIFDIPKMDCPSEENLIRMALRGNSEVRTLDFDLKGRKLAITHFGEASRILKLLEPLGFGAKLLESKTLSSEEFEAVSSIVKEVEANPKEGQVLKILLAINFAMFAFEIVFGLVAESTGLIADSFDMLADAVVYGISLYAVGKNIKAQQHSARASGYMQMALSLFALSEVIRRFFYGSEPLAVYMMGISVLALIANVSCLILISKYRTGGVHMQASWIFSTNDVLANIGVITAGVLVYFTQSHIPDLVIGLIISVIVFRGALSILKISSPRLSSSEIGGEKQ